MARILSTKAKPDQRQDQRKEVLRFGKWPINLCNWAIGCSANREWIEENDDYQLRLHLDRHGDPRIVLHWPRYGKDGRERTPRTVAVGDLEVLLFLNAFARKTEIHQHFEQAFASTSEDIRAENKARLDGKWKIADAQTDQVRGKATSEDVMVTFAQHNERFGPSSERAVGTHSFARRFDKLSRRRKKDVWIEFRSIRALLIAMGRDDGPKARHSLVRSLRLWRRLVIEHRHWTEDEETRRKMIGPIITGLELPKNGRGRIRIRVCRRWLNLLADNFIKVKLPLKVRGNAIAEFNLRCLLKCWLRREDSRFNSWPIDRLVDLIGLPEGPDWRRREYLQALITRLGSRKRFPYEITMTKGDLKARFRESQQERRTRLAEEREEQDTQRRESIAEMRAKIWDETLDAEREEHERVNNLANDLSRMGYEPA